MTNVLLIPGSTREDSPHTAALRIAQRHAPAGLGVTFYEGLRGLPAYVPGEPHPSPTVTELRAAVRAADAVLFATPEYAGGLPGALKNLLDWLSESGELAGKPVAWFSVDEHGRSDNARATLETVLLHLDAQLLRAACIRVPLKIGTVVDPRLCVVLEDVAQVLIRAIVARPAPQSAVITDTYRDFPTQDRLRDAAEIRLWTIRGPHQG